MLQHLPALLVVVPLTAGPLCVLVRHGGVAWLVASLTGAFSFVASLLVLLQVHADGPISYHMGGWAPPVGIEYRIDALSAFILVIVAGAATAVLLYARRTVEQEIAVARRHLFYCMFLLCLAGLLGMAATGDAFNVFVFLEISSLSTYTLVAMSTDRRALRAAFQYLILGTIGATFFLIGVGFAYMMTGTLNMADMAVRLAEIGPSAPVEAALAFIVVGLALKLAIFSLHFWMPNAYAYSPTAVSIFLAATSTKVSIYLVMRFVFTVFAADFGFFAEALGLLLATAGIAAIFYGSVVAIYQVNMKRMLAYSSVAQIGYIVAAIALATVPSLTAATLHIFYHALMKATLFAALGCIAYRVGSTRIDRMAGIARDMPWTMAAFLVGGLSLIGIPLTGGFISKWFLLAAALDAGLWWLAAIVVVGSLLAIIYVWRVVEAAYLREPPAGRAAVREAPLSMLLPTLALAFANLWFGVFTAFPIDASQRAAAGLLGAGP